MTPSSDHSRQSSSQRFFLNLWYRSPKHKHLLSYCLLPLSWLFIAITFLRRYWLKRKQSALAVPVVVVGNISIGGTGKTPVVIAMVQALQERGIKVGVISRGYGSHASEYPFLVTSESSVNESGDEALLIAKASQCPVVIDRQRLHAANKLLELYPDTQIIISDDGLQHYRLPRALEVVVIDGERGLGNGLCLPAGPLRETAARLSSVNWVLTNGKLMHSAGLQQCSKLESLELKPQCWQHIGTEQYYKLLPLPWQREQKAEKPSTSECVALAAIGHPERFFNTLKSLKILQEANTQLAFDDHHEFSEEDFIAIDKDAIVLMTTKDAVKCRQFAQQDWWALEVSLKLPEALIDDIAHLI